MTQHYDRSTIMEEPEDIYGEMKYSDAYFVTCQDAGKTAFLLGPFTTEKACMDFAQFREDNPESRLSEVIQDCEKIDKKAHFFSYGMARVRDFKAGEIKGVLNRFNPEKWNGVLA